MTLSENIYSYCKPNVIYGKKGEKVKIISNVDGVCIVEGEQGQRFSVRIEKLIK